MTSRDHFPSVVASLPVLNADYLQQRYKRELPHRRFMVRMRKAPHRRVLWYDGMPDSEARECQYCGTDFVPDLEREIAIPAAPPSVLAHRRAHCSEYCDYTISRGIICIDSDEDRKRYAAQGYQYGSNRADAREAPNEARSSGQRCGRARVSVWLQIGHPFSSVLSQYDLNGGLRWQL